METVEVVIKVPKDIYEALKADIYPIPDPSRVAAVFKALLQNGIVLPKGHGRLGDLDALYEDVINGIKAGNYEEGYEKYAHINNIDDCVECIKYADTIIEADKGGEG